MKTFSAFPAVVIPLFALVFVSCVLDKEKSPEGVVDPATMGASLNSGFVFMGGWEQSVATSLDSIPATSTSMSVALSKTSALGKRAVTAGDTVSVDSSTKAQNYVTVAVKIPGLFGFQTTYDTAVVKYDDKYRDTVHDNENIIRFSQTIVWTTGAVDRAAYSDDDGDGLINYVAGRSNRVRVVFTHSSTWLAKPLLATGTVVVGPGPDNNYTTGADNIVYQAAWTRSWGGRTDSLYFQNNHGTGEIVANDTLHLFIRTTSSLANDTLASLLVDIAFNPGPNLKSPSDDSLYSVHVTCHKRAVFERVAEFSFTPSAPVPHGQPVQSGSFSAEVTFSNDKSATLTGTFSASGYQATYTGPGGVVKTVVYSKTGVVVSGG